MGSTFKQDPEQVSPQRKAGIGFLIGIRGGTEKQKTRKRGSDLPMPGESLSAEKSPPTEPEAWLSVAEAFFGQC